MAFKVTFYGGAEIVTGSQFLVEGSEGTVLVDCGIEQGKDACDACNFAPFGYDVQKLDAVIITHAHLDHIGLLPRLVHDGYKGKIFMTEPTKDLTEAMLRDGAKILDQEAHYKHMDPLYSIEDVIKLLSLIETKPLHEEWQAAKGISVFLRNTGHILGSASVRLKDSDGTTLAFTGDIGNSPTELLPDAEPIPDADTILIESVYGDRANPEKPHRLEHLRSILLNAQKTGGTILIPSFSIERTQLLLYEISLLIEKGLIPEIPVFLDSPLAITVTEIYEKWGKKYFNPEAEKELAHMPHLFEFPFLTMTRSQEESEKIRNVKGSKIIMAGAGMSHGGRIGKWEHTYLTDPKTTMVMVGYQAPGSPGRIIQDGGKRVYIDRRPVTIRAKVETLYGWSGHADRDGLLEFAKRCLPTTKNFFVGLGEPASARFLAQRIYDFLGVKAVVPAKGETWEVTKVGIQKMSR